MAQDKNEEMKEEEVVETTEETTPEKSELTYNERADEFENKYLRAHAEMQNIQRRANEERQKLVTLSQLRPGKSNLTIA